MKTATIRVYHVFGTKKQTSADVLYRGKVLKFFEGIDTPQKYLEMARQWSHQNGFSHTKIFYG